MTAIYGIHKNTGQKQVIESDDGHLHVRDPAHSQDGIGGGTALGVMTDHISSSCNTIEANSTHQASRLSNIQDWVGTQDGAGGGTKTGVTIDHISSSNNTIASNSTLQASRLNNIQTVQTDGTQISKVNAVITTGEFLATGTSIADDAFSASALPCTGYKAVRIFGKWTGASMDEIPLMGSQTESGTYYALKEDQWLAQQEMALGGVSTYYVYAEITNPPPFLKVYNQSGTAKVMELDFVGFSN